ncbi:MAG: heat shock protein HSP20 [Candidatus Magnetoglobus multicellularis str. Araruama]|uniref:Heat shock protein HSP20 n=1 Tax=Candidatus Magnetoglobus multicellularis str. Araruama TaxID=890399 RepID=A0A1V1P2D4_9BACT|nr:MAG: heat shock protein HSP20 [Candidatus Magnetoglobus multicellularis str. Araruama]
MAFTTIFQPTGYNRLYQYDILQNEMNRLFDSFFGGQRRGRRSAGFPALNVSQDTDNIYVTAELPGIDVNDVEINVNGDSLHIKGERKLPETGSNVRYHRQERGSGQFSRTIQLPFPVNTEKVSAEMKLGVLTISLPKADEAKPRKINIKTA